ncbi:MAG: sigma-70 family RNA polymerase sigma factor, partial [Sphingobacterium sp.]|nr:sigma-70 family RNA polymerase sigma factor [Sphingobacterium sp.]
MFAFKSSKKDSTQDHELLQQYQETSDLKVLGNLYQRHTEMAYYVCLRYLQDPELSKDAVMNIFEELIYKVNKQEIKDFPR